jgi:hypothetical protein
MAVLAVPLVFSFHLSAMIVAIIVVSTNITDEHRQEPYQTQRLS